MDIVELVSQYGIYVGFAVVVAGLVEALKRAFPKFFKKTQAGARVLPFLPIVLGLGISPVLPLEGLQLQFLTGCALGTVSASLYKIVTRTLASKVKIAGKLED